MLEAIPMLPALNVESIEQVWGEVKFHRLAVQRGHLRCVDDLDQHMALALGDSACCVYDRK